MANDFGVTPDGFKIRRFEDIYDSLEENVRNALGVEASVYPDSVEGQLITVFSLTYSELWGQLKECYDAYNPNAVIGQNLDNLVLLNGLFRLQAQPSIALLVCTGVVGTVIPQGSEVSNVDTGDVFITTTAATIETTGSVEVYAESEVTGRVLADIDKLTVIETPINGWSTVTNPSAAIVGRDLETDAELRVRRTRSLALAGNASFDAILARVSQVSGVTFVAINENETDVTNLEGVPPHSFIVVVQGGTDVDIGNAIWDTKPIGVGTSGNTNVAVLDSQLDSHTINFSRPTLIPIYLRTNITFLTGQVPGDAVQTLKDSIIAWTQGTLVQGRGFGVGEDVIVSQLYQPINFTYDDILVNQLEVSLNGSVWEPISIAIAFDALSSWDEVNISVTVG